MLKRRKRCAPGHSIFETALKKLRLKSDRSDVQAGEPEGIVVGRGGGFTPRRRWRLVEFVLANF
jgi:hypothetical protein